jgi:hypothetical protein
MISLIAVSPFILQSCDDDPEVYYVRMVTLKLDGNDKYLLETDNGDKINIVSSDVRWYKPEKDQRVLIYYDLLSKDDEKTYNIHLEHISGILTKTVEELTVDDEEKYGNDKVYIEKMWIGGDYLNVRFRFYLPYYTKHRVSLVKNTIVENPDDDYIYLEYRYNNEDDITPAMRRSYVSFDLGEYAPSVADKKYKGIKVKINSVKNGEVTIPLDFGENSTEDRNIENPEEFDPAEGKIK